MGSRLRNGMTNYHPSHAKSHKIVVSQDRYLVGSPKSHERKGASTPPPPHMSLSSRQHSSHENKSWGVPPTRKSFLNSSQNVPWEKRLKKLENDYDLEEAGITMVGSALEKLSNGAKNVSVTTDDTAVLILLMYFIQKKTQHRKHLPTFKAFWWPGHRCEGIYHHAWSEMFLVAWTA